MRRCLISDSALKVVFLTTLYVDVKEPAAQYILTTKKLNLVPTNITVFPPWQVSVFVAGTKLSPICSPKMYVERAPS
jgi:hypothetical protein